MKTNNKRVCLPENASYVHKYLWGYKELPKDVPVSFKQLRLFSYESLRLLEA